MNDDWGLLLSHARADGVLSGHVPAIRVSIRRVSSLPEDGIEPVYRDPAVREVPEPGEGL